MKIAVYRGGTSMERDVSLNSAKFIGDTLAQMEHEVLYVDPAFSPEQFNEKSAVDYSIEGEPPSLDEIRELNHRHIFQLLLHEKVAAADFHFIGLHGGIGENGLLQGMFEHLGYQYNGPNASASAVAMDKHLTKQIMVAQGIPTAEWLMVSQSRWKENSSKVRAIIEEKFTPGIVVKPNSQGSTIGLTILHSLAGLAEALEKAFEYEDQVMVEQYIPGREITASVLGKEALPLVEIKPKHDIYDYECKYGEGMSSYEVPADLKDPETEEIQQYALRLFNSIGASGYSRVDFRLSTGGEPLCLEINTLPGMTGTSLVPKAAKAAGLTNKELLLRIIDYGQK
ncbi:MAG: D-alanine--D-alanine ligase [Candidatus Marinimicrobia bacterium]|nr:D-alanine--D-alanine ligase [Candidatus Neomarinimicrobiota bacterium]MCF7827455.1 D-alanine--D-alanine ligase [Candidatus Neomarinimicrobiota bacterium]MCF7882330.1 D-alanine--D-alanine ligase [Candidatus Neomarinimicrobiota bacterium]